MGRKRSRARRAVPGARLSFRRRSRFEDLVGRQLDLFEQDQADLIAACDAAESAYDRAPRDEAEERYGEYLDLVETAADLLADLRDHYARALDEDVADEYTRTFSRAVARRLPRLARDVDAA